MIIFVCGGNVFMTTKVVGKMEGRILWAIEIRAKQRDCVLVCSNLSTGTLLVVAGLLNCLL